MSHYLAVWETATQVVHVLRSLSTIGSIQNLIICLKMAWSKHLYETIQNITSICHDHLQNEYGPDIAPSLSSPLYCKQIEYSDQKILSLSSTKGKQNVDPLDY